MTVQPHDEENIETLSSGVAALVDETDDEDEDDSESYRARIVPLGEGDVTTGGSGKKTYWDAETLREGVESGAFDGAKLLKGRPGEGHKSMLEQASPDEIVGQVPSFDYEDGVGPVGDGDILDEHLAKLVEHELLEVSPDMWRVLGEYDEELGAYRVDEIIDVPYITLLDRGASDGASISPAEDGTEALGAAVTWGDRVTELAETLGMPSDSVRDRLEQLADEDRDDVDVELEEQLSRLFTLRFTAYGEMFGEEFLDEAVENLETISGISAARSESQDNPELIAIIDREAVDSLDDLNDEIVGALEETPFEVHDSFDWVEDVAWEGLGESSPDGSTSDEPAEPGAGSADTTPQMDNAEELQEQLADMRSERDELESERDELAEQLSEKEETIENYEDQIEQLEDEVEPLAEMLAELVAEDSVLTADAVADRFKPSEMVEMLAENAGWDEDDDRSKVEVVKEQLSGPPSPRGEGGDPEGGAGGLTEEDLVEAEQLADEVMTAEDRLSAGDSGREYLKQTYDVDPAEFDSASELRAAIRDNGGD